MPTLLRLADTGPSTRESFPFRFDVSTPGVYVVNVVFDPQGGKASSVPVEAHYRPGLGFVWIDRLE